MKPGPPLQRRAPLQARSRLERAAGLEVGGPLARGYDLNRANGLARTGPTPRAARRTGPRQTAADLVDDRAQGRCEHDGQSLAGGRERHHRQPRGRGGTSDVTLNAPSNLVVLCPACHAWAESHRDQARQLGLLVSRPRDPATVPVLLMVGWVLLTDTGEYLPTSDPRSPHP